MVCVVLYTDEALRCSGGRRACEGEFPASLRLGRLVCVAGSWMDTSRGKKKEEEIKLDYESLILLFYKSCFYFE